MTRPPTKTYLKLRDAAAQMKLAIANARDEEVHRSCVNSFISHARSVTFVMQKESATVPGLTEWYEKKRGSLAADPLFRFFNQSRVHTIHKGVVEPTRGTLSLRSKVSRAAVVDEHGQESDVRFSGVFGPEAAAVRPGDVVFGMGQTAIYWTFEGVEEFLPGHSGNVERLCEDYFVKLKALVIEWEAERIARSSLPLRRVDGLIRPPK